MGKRIAIADDDREIRDLLKEALGRRGYEVTVVPNGLRLLAALQIDNPALVVLDVNMSWIDGFELCSGMKRNPTYRDIPVLFMSGKNSPADIKRGLDCGAADYITKPFSLRDFMSRVERILGPEQAA